jgi:hypothetical protein
LTTYVSGRILAASAVHTHTTAIGGSMQNMDVRQDPATVPVSSLRDNYGNLIERFERDGVVDVRVTLGERIDRAILPNDHEMRERCKLTVLRWYWRSVGVVAESPANALPNCPHGNTVTNCAVCN